MIDFTTSKDDISFPTSTTETHTSELIGITNTPVLYSRNISSSSRSSSNLERDVGDEEQSDVSTMARGLEMNENALHTSELLNITEKHNVTKEEEEEEDDDAAVLDADNYKKGRKEQQQQHHELRKEDMVNFSNFISTQVAQPTTPDIFYNNQSENSSLDDSSDMIEERVKFPKTF